jgi:hypothetical protein
MACQPLNEDALMTTAIPPRPGPVPSPSGGHLQAQALGWVVRATDRA